MILLIGELSSLAIHRLSADSRLTPSVRFSSGRYDDVMAVQYTLRASRRVTRFPNTIREYRLKAGLSQSNLAAMLGRGKDAVSSWERGLSLPSVLILMRMAKILGTLAESLYRDYYDAFRQEGVADAAKQ